MGNNKSHYSREEFLYYCIERKDYSKIEETLAKNPELINKPLAKDTKQTALMRASYNGNLELTRMFINLKANPNEASKKGETALTIAVNRNHIEIVKLLIEAGANPNYIAETGLRAIDYAVLNGFYNIAEHLFKFMNTEEKSFREPEAYEILQKKYAMRYVNYRMFLEGLVNGTSEDELGDYLRREKVVFVDPVLNPNETWKAWVKRQIQFKDAPLVERSSLPENMQPQNRLLGKLHHMTDKFMRTPTSLKPSLHPVRSEAQSEMDEIKIKSNENSNEVRSDEGV